MGCLSVLVLVASLLAVQVRFVTGCSIKGEVQCNEMFPFLQNVNNNFLPLLSWRLLTRKYWFCWFLWWESYDSLSFISFQLDIRNLMGQGKVPSQYITIGDKSQHPEQYDMISFTKCHENDVEERFFSAAFLIYSHSFWQETKLCLWSSTFCKNSKTPQNSYFLWKFWQNFQAADLRQKTWAERARRSAGDDIFFEDWLD